MSDIEELLKKHTGDVTRALSGFEGQVSSLDELVKKLQSDIDKFGNSVPRSAVGRLLPTLPGPRSVSGLASGASPRLSITDSDRAVMAAVLRGSGSTSAMREGSDPDGGILVPEDLRTELEVLITRQSPMRRVAKTINFTTSRTVIPINTRGAAAGWVGEDEERTETEAPALAALNAPGGTVYALPVATEELVDDAIMNLEVFLEENVVDAIAEKESQAFISGNGQNKPQGFLAGAAPTAEIDDDRALGTIQYIPSGTADNLTAANLLQAVLGMIFSVKAGYRQAPGTAFLASTAAISHIAQLKDADGRSLYLPSVQEGVPGMLLGYPVEEFEHMDGITPNAFPLAFGNWQRGYIIGDRTKLNVLRDPFTTKGKVKWYFRKRVYGSVLNSEAIKVLKIAAA